MQHSTDSGTDSDGTSWLLAAFSICAACALLVGCIPNGDTPGTSASPSDLQTVELSVGALQPVFASTTASYTVLAADSAQSTYVTATTSAPAARLVINNQPAVSGKAFGPIPLDPDLAKSTIITVVVVPTGSAQPRSYTITVARAGNADLKTLTVVPGTVSPIFSPDVLSYRVNVGNNVTIVGITATAQDLASSVTINGVATTSYSLTNLQVGDNAATVRVRAVAGATQDYVVTVVRAAPPSTDTSLASAQFSAVVAGGVRELGQCPTNQAQTAFSVTPVPNGTDKVTVKAVPGNSAGTIKINTQQVAAGTSIDVPLTVIGNNTITVEVAAPAGNKTAYTFVVNRAPSLFSGNNSLWKLSTTAGALSPEFCHNRTNYDVTTTAASATVTAVLADPASTLRINGVMTQSGTPSAVIALAKGKNDVKIGVTAQNGSALTYIITITRS